RRHSCPPHYVSHPVHAPLTTALPPLSLHDALPISRCFNPQPCVSAGQPDEPPLPPAASAPARIQPDTARTAPAFDPSPERVRRADRKSTRLNSSHLGISYAVFCLKKKNKSQTM